MSSSEPLSCALSRARELEALLVLGQQGYSLAETRALALESQLATLANAGRTVRAYINTLSISITEEHIAAMDPFDDALDAAEGKGA